MSRFHIFLDFRVILDPAKILGSESATEPSLHAYRVLVMCPMGAVNPNLTKFNRSGVSDPA